MHYYFISAGVEGVGDVRAVQLITKFGMLVCNVECFFLESKVYI